MGLCTFRRYLLDLRARHIWTDLEIVRLAAHCDKLLAVLFPRRGPTSKTLHGYCVLARRDRKLRVLAGANTKDILTVKRNVVAIRRTDQAARANEHQRR